MHDALVTANWQSVGRLLREEWELRRTNAPGISTPLIDKLIREAQRNGARAAKVCGAGGGGCVVFFCDPDAHARVTRAVRSAGGKILAFQVARDGLTLTRGAER
jgi:D-glycero-alpha-D-manno-heptose-7-phosphate kinase